MTAGEAEARYEDVLAEHEVAALIGNGSLTHVKCSCGRNLPSESSHRAHLAAALAASEASLEQRVRERLNGHGLVGALHDIACEQRTTHGDTCTASTKSGMTPYDFAEAVKTYLLPADRSTVAAQPIEGTAVVEGER